MELKELPKADSLNKVVFYHNGTSNEQYTASVAPLCAVCHNAMLDLFFFLGCECKGHRSQVSPAAEALSDALRLGLRKCRGSSPQPIPIPSASARGTQDQRLVFGLGLPTRPAHLLRWTDQAAVAGRPFLLPHVHQGCNNQDTVHCPGTADSEHGLAGLEVHEARRSPTAAGSPTSTEAP